MSSAKEAQMILDPSSTDAVLEEQARADKEIAKDAEKLVGRVSHDELCNTVHGKLIEGDIDEDLFSISISELEVSEQNKAKQ